MSMAGMNNLARISMLNTNLVPDEMKVKLKKGGALGSFDEEDEEQVRPRRPCPHACAGPFPSAHARLAAGQLCWRATLVLQGRATCNAALQHA